MAKSRFEYVRNYERDQILLPNTYILIRVDGRGFHRFSTHYQFQKPNDERALRLMNASAEAVMGQIAEICGAYGQSDEFSFIFNRTCSLFDRRESKLVSTVASTFTAHYIFLWNKYFPDTSLEPSMLPTFDSRAVLYPSAMEVRDYFSWRQADCHINNLYNTSFWALVQSGKSEQEAEQALMGTNSADKNELLFSQFQINYNNIEPLYRKGTMLIRKLKSPPVSKYLQKPEKSQRQLDREAHRQRKADIVLLHDDIIGDKFWDECSTWLI
ncbi:Thg1 C terminal domain-containing protein [Lipomyces oligophaga]|uniref:Thg1 C terminal domain-containing protein n=1 Tax=Lipomyces oligophaga TaxID=45792 RepID=UPI0034CFFD13